ncbi:hypothetical protein PLICRDRAFT_490895 [Plicaturopsis crispa FD-325 SS-3]|nr:hypothetical protein PLICRDRAFT_490895 [Plicaturopsis crispa FD-325 SS-3]
MSSSATVVSSPGKVLVAGGYLVLDPAFSGVVVSTSSRFYTSISEAPSGNEIRVRSPQFVDATWVYSVNFVEGGIQVDNVTQESKNKFVHLALQSTLAVAVEIKGVDAVKQSLSKGLDIAIVGDNDFYSQRAKLAELNLPRSLASLSHIPPFTPTGVRLPDVHKTGLGSSAALITSLVSGLLLHLSAIPRAAFSEVSSEGRHLAHNLSQYVHCLAQGKVGSGFDVSAAVFGSQLYTRFDPEVLQSLMKDDSLRKEPLLPVLSPSNKAWNYQVKPFQLPPLTRLMLADVDAGSDTPSLVGKVLKWRKDHSDKSTKHWGDLDQSNQALAQTLLRLSQLHAENAADYASAVKYISSLRSIQWLANPNLPASETRVVQAFYDVHTHGQDIREKMREMGAYSGVPIEPEEQTHLLNACISLPGVIAGGVPGAGGYDAIWLLICDAGPIPHQSPPIDLVEGVWGEWKELDVSPLSASESTAKGVRIENPEEIPGLSHAISSK